MLVAVTSDTTDETNCEFLNSEEDQMSCRSCQSENRRRLGCEINIHFPGLRGLEKPTVMVTPEIVVCLNCGYTEFKIADTELRLLAEGSGEKGTIT